MLDTAANALGRLQVLAGSGPRLRHQRKYAEGTLGDDKSFWFRGPQDKLKLRARNLMLFLQIGDGVDAETWQWHRERGDFSRWVATSLKE
jgi:hypothetical protein